MRKKNLDIPAAGGFAATAVAGFAAGVVTVAGFAAAGTAAVFVCVGGFWA